ncbi:hypothetical protein TUM4249_10050 [Shewanella sp. KT0246]|nr:hypothetical protein TUM4249_10050 [Shewanella sp. KT0246]
MSDETRQRSLRKLGTLSENDKNAWKHMYNTYIRTISPHLSLTSPELLPLKTYTILMYRKRMTAKLEVTNGAK